MSAPRVLIVEDDSWFAEQQARTLQSAGFASEVVADGIAAIKALDASPPDAIILDIFLPGPNALTLLHEIQSYTDLAKIPIIVCTSSAADIPPGSLTRYGVRSVIDKASMTPGDLVAAVKRELP